MRTALALCLLAASLAGAQTVVVKEATGESAVVGADEQKAFAEAKERALRAAIEQAAGVRIDADTVVVNNQLVRDQIFMNTSGYVKSHEVVSKKVEKGVVTVKVKAEVITEALEKDLAAARDLVKRAGRPTIVVLLNEQTLQQGKEGQALTTSDAVATVLRQKLAADGWDVKDPAFAMGKVRVAPGATLGAAEAKEIGDLSKVQYILYGTVTLRNHPAPPLLAGAQVFPVTGEYDLSLFATDNGTQISKVSGKLAYPGAPGRELEAAKKMLVSYERSAFDIVQLRKDEIIEPVRKGVLEHLRSGLVNGTSITVSVTGLDGFTSARDFKKAVEAIKGVKDADDPRLEKGKATFRVTFLGSSQDLATRVEAATFKKKKLSVTTVTDGTLEVAVAR